MGGNAFNGSLYTPRMPEKVYRRVQEHVESRLKCHFTHVGHPIEAPAKTDHGDIDVLVAIPTSQDTDCHLHGVTNIHAFVAKFIGAQTWKKNGGTTHAALPWPEDLLEMAPGASSGSGDTEAPPYVQIDIHVFSTVEDLNWCLFKHAHGDLWSILGGVIRRFGLTSTSDGLYLRIAEIEKHNKAQSRVQMTTDPTLVLQYLGLDVEQYWQPFNTLEDLMAYAVTSRFHDPGRWKDKNDDLKAKDRHRTCKRQAFGFWIDTYLPSHYGDACGKDAHLTREEVIEDAKAFFGPEFASQFDTRKEKCTRQISEAQLWVDIRKELQASGTEIGFALKGMKREIAGPGSGDSVEVQQVRDAFSEGRYEDVLKWATLNSKAVSERQKEIDRERYHQHLMKKIQREKNSEVGPVD